MKRRTQKVTTQHIQGSSGKHLLLPPLSEIVRISGETLYWGGRRKFTLLLFHLLSNYYFYFYFP